MWFDFTDDRKHLPCGHFHLGEKSQSHVNNVCECYIFTREEFWAFSCDIPKNKRPKLMFVEWFRNGNKCNTQNRLKTVFKHRMINIYKSEVWKQECTYNEFGVFCCYFLSLLCIIKRQRTKYHWHYKGRFNKQWHLLFLFVVFKLIYCVSTSVFVFYMLENDQNKLKTKLYVFTSNHRWILCHSHLKM